MLVTVGTAGAQEPEVPWEDAASAARAIRSPDPSVRIQAIRTLDLWGGEEWGDEGDYESYNSVVAALRAALDDVDPGVREAAAYAISKVDHVPLLKLVDDPDAGVRSTVVRAIGPAAAHGGNDPEQRAVLVNIVYKALKDRSPEVRAAAAYALASPEFESLAVADSLLAVTSDPHPAVRVGAIYALGAQALLPINARVRLHELLSDPDPAISLESAIALSAHSSRDPDVVEVILGTVRAPGNPELRVRAIEASGWFPMSDHVVLALLPAARDSDAVIRGAAIKRLGSGPSTRRALPVLREALRDTMSAIRLDAVNGLAYLGAAGHTAIPDLTRALEDRDGGVRDAAAGALRFIGEALQDSADDLSYSELRHVIPAIGTALATLDSIKAGTGPRAEILHAASVSLHRSRQHLSAEIETRQVSRALTWAKTHWYVGGVVAYVLGFLLLWFVVYRVAPLRLLALAEALRPVPDVTLPAWLGGGKASLRSAILLSPFQYRPRVLDAWVGSHVGVARERFKRKSTVRARSIHVPVPVVMDGNVVPAIAAPDLRSTFRQQRGCLLLWGEGGSGKSSLACQVGLWAIAEQPENRLCEHLMLPVLIDEDLGTHLTKGRRLLETIRGQLTDLAALPDPVSPTLLLQLLRQRRILVIIDHLSEMSEESRSEIQPGDPGFAANAVVVTSRAEEPLGHVDRTSISPLRIEGNRLSSFMEAYLVRRGVRGLFDDSEFFAACARLSVMVKDRGITVLLAKLYADEIVRSKQGAGQAALPESVPDLMRGYVTVLNRSLETSRRPDREVQRDAGIVAWECLQSTLTPAPAWRSLVVGALGRADAEARLEYLENRLHLVETIGAARDRVRFSLDPLAEYLAAQHLVEQFGGDESDWQAFFERVDSIPGAAAPREGFLLGLRDCCRAGIEAIQVPAWVPEEISLRLKAPPSAPRQVAEPAADAPAA